MGTKADKLLRPTKKILFRSGKKKNKSTRGEARERREGGAGGKKEKLKRFYVSLNRSSDRPTEQKAQEKVIYKKGKSTSPFAPIIELSFSPRPPPFYPFFPV